MFGQKRISICIIYVSKPTHIMADMHGRVPNHVLSVFQDMSPIFTTITVGNTHFYAFCQVLNARK